MGFGDCGAVPARLGRDGERRVARRSFELDSAGRCGDLDSAVEGDRVWMTCTCGAVINCSTDDD
jgi:hypothetical protein